MHVFDPDQILVIEVLADGEVVMAGEPEFERLDVDEQLAGKLIGFTVPIPDTIGQKSLLTVQVADHDFISTAAVSSPGALSSRFDSAATPGSFSSFRRFCIAPIIRV
ncbi:MAG: hypothetical protein R3C04_10700 [Hyphomonas sp.]